MNYSLSRTEPGAEAEDAGREPGSGTRITGAFSGPGHGSIKDEMVIASVDNHTIPVADSVTFRAVGKIKFNLHLLSLLSHQITERCVKGQRGLISLKVIHIQG